MNRYGYIGRRDMLHWLGAGACSLVAGSLWPTQLVHAAENTPVLTPDVALKQLLAGNQRFVRQERQYPHQSAAWLQTVAFTQHPFATILTCADSRVPVEILFDQGFGDLFDIRVAGNVVTPEVLGSLEFAAVVLNCPLIMVLGHERCGAVTAAVKGDPLPGQMGSFVKAIAPTLSTDSARRLSLDQEVDRVVTANVKYQLSRILESSSLLSQRVNQGTLNIVSGRYDLDTGTVELI
jgi:carbonic anhydrase